MSRSVIDAVISTPNARAKLKEGLHWREVEKGFHIGYRKNKRGGNWLARWYLGNQRYHRIVLPKADDVTKADGLQCLSFEQARTAGKAAYEKWRSDAIAEAEGPAPTVRSAVETYIAKRDARFAAQTGFERGSDANRLAKHALSDEKLSTIKLHELKERDLTRWRSRLPSQLAGTTKRRIGNDLKAALNGAASEYRDRLPAEIFTVIKHGLRSDDDGEAVARDNRALPEHDIRRIVETALALDNEIQWDGDLYRMVVVLAATGARFSQIRRMRVSDVQPDAGRLMVPTSRKGRGQKKGAQIGIQVRPDIIAALVPAIAGRKSGEPLLTRWRHKQMPAEKGQPPRWVRDGRGAWKNSSELTRYWKTIIERVGIPSDIVPYALRHSSIVRQLRAHLPVRLVAEFHDTSSAMIEKHYAGAISDAFSELSASAAISLTPEPKDNVSPLRKVAG